MRDFTAIVLAAGKGTRMKSTLPKVLHPVCGRPMLFYPLDVLKRLGARDITVVVGSGADEVRGALHGIRASFCVQRPQLGTGHAVRCAIKGRGKTGRDTLILSGDVPLIKEATVRALFTLHRGKRRQKDRPAVTLVTVVLHDPAGYGRVIRDRGGRVERVVEERDLAPGQRDIREVNAGIYLVDSAFLKDNLGKLGRRNVQKEYYLPDLVSLAYKKGRGVTALTHADLNEVMGVNNRVELARASAIMRGRILTALMLDGVTVIDPAATYVDCGVRVGRDTTLYPNVRLAGDTIIGRGCVIEEGARVVDSIIGDGAAVKGYSIIESSEVGPGASIGPFARLRPGSVIGRGARIGNFVEVKNSVIGRNSKANHLSYIGDAVIGRDVNIGAGAITCNYDGREKHVTTIEDGAFIGSDSQLVAPVVVGKNSYIGSGSTITKDVPAGSLALTRPEQRVIKGWTKKRRGGKKKK